MMRRAVPPAAEPAMMAVRWLEVGLDGAGIVLGIVVWVCKEDVDGGVWSGDGTYEYLGSIDVGSVCGGDDRWGSLLRRCWYGGLCCG